MKVTSKINIDLRHPNPGVRVDAVQGDVNTRAVEISLFDGGAVWTVPSGVTAALAYKKPDSQQGCLDGSASVTVRGSTITIVMTKQMLAAPGTVNACVVLTDASKNQLTAFPFSVSVAANPAADVQQSDDPIKVDTSDATASAGDILAGKTAYVNGKKVTGSIASRSAQTITPGTADQTIASGQYLSGKQTIKGDANLLAKNIKSGVTVFGVGGTYAGTGGLDTSDATATAEDIEKGKTAYVNGEKITGSLTPINGLTAPATLDFNESAGKIKLAYANTEKTLFKANGTINLTADASNFGDATADDVAAGKTFTSAAGLMVTGTHVCQVVAGGLTVKTGTTTSQTIDTGLSSIKYLVIYKSSVAGTGFIQGFYVADKGTTYYVYCSSYGSYVSSSGASTDTNATVEGGTFTWTRTGESAKFSDGVTYNWYAFGEA